MSIDFVKFSKVEKVQHEIFLESQCEIVLGNIIKNLNPDHAELFDRIGKNDSGINNTEYLEEFESLQLLRQEGRYNSLYVYQGTISAIKEGNKFLKNIFLNEDEVIVKCFKDLAYNCKTMVVSRFGKNLLTIANASSKTPENSKAITAKHTPLLQLLARLKIVTQPSKFSRSFALTDLGRRFMQIIMELNDVVRAEIYKENQDLSIDLPES